MKTTHFKKGAFGYIELIRPFTLLAPIIVSMCIMIASFFHSGKTGDLSNLLWSTILPASFTLAVLNAASNALNQAADFKSDKISKSYRPIPGGLVTINQAKTLAVILYILAFYMATTINIMFTIFIVLIAVFTITYSIAPRMKDFLFL